MPEGFIEFHAWHTPAHWDDKMKTVTLSCSVRQIGGDGSGDFYTHVSPTVAREYAAQIIRACEIVESESN